MPIVLGGSSGKRQVHKPSVSSLHPSLHYYDNVQSRWLPIVRTRPLLHVRGNLPSAPFSLHLYIPFSGRHTDKEGTVSVVIPQMLTLFAPLPHLAFQIAAESHPGKTECIPCGHPYSAHKPKTAPVQPPPALTSPQGPLGVPWHGDQPHLSIGGDPQRRIEANHHNPWGPGVGVSYARGPHQPFPSGGSKVAFPPGGSSTRGGKGKSRGKAQAQIRATEEEAPTSIVLYFALFPISVCTLPNEVAHDFFNTYSELFSDTGEFRMEGSGTALFHKLKEFNLMFQLELPLNHPPNQSIYEAFEDMLTKVMKSRHMSFADETLPFSLNPFVLHSAEYHARHFQERLYNLHSVGNLPKKGFGRRFGVVDIPWYSFNVRELTNATGPLKGWASPINPGQFVHFISPAYGPIRGIVPRLSPTDFRICLPWRVLAGISGTHLSEEDPRRACFEVCSESQLFAVPSSADPPVCKGKGRGAEPGESATTPLFLPESPPPSLIYDDENDEDFQAALRLSLQDTVGSTSARPETPPLQTRPRSTEFGTPPASQRRRTAASSISPVAGPSRHSSFSNSTFTTTYSWLSAVERILPSPSSVSISGSTIEAMAQTVLGHIRELYGGEPWTPANPLDAGTISAPPNTPSAHILMKPRPSWNVGGASVGDGVGRSVLDALMVLVFADQAIWKDIGDQKVIQTEPRGVVVSPQRLADIRTYGYACMLYLIHCRALPEQLSIVFAGSALQLPKITLFDDDDYLRLAAPAQMDILDAWPTSPSGFANATHQLAFLTGTYLERQPPALLSLTQETFDSYTLNIKRRVLYGTDVPFESSPEFQAFASTFNYVLKKSEPQVTLAQSFGRSLKPLMIKLSASRLQSVEDLLSRIRWLSTNKDDLIELEIKYKEAFTRYISAPGIVCHPLLPMEKLMPSEREADPTNPLVRALMFLMSATGTQQLPPAKASMIEMTFHRRLGDSLDAPDVDVVANPNHWPDHLPLVKMHTCFEQIEVPLEPVATLLNQPLPEDNTATDFDLYHRFSEYGGLL
ncbi:hypothetical protein C8R43DRAFT_942129 [Mycena crocata]|nr:hypothetical protein C8R43DRAFT_942129 [Mycena crocata]